MSATRLQTAPAIPSGGLGEGLGNLPRTPNDFLGFPNVVMGSFGGFHCWIFEGVGVCLACWYLVGNKGNYLVYIPLYYIPLFPTINGSWFVPLRSYPLKVSLGLEAPGRQASLSSSMPFLAGPKTLIYALKTRRFWVLGLVFFKRFFFSPVRCFGDSRKLAKRSPCPPLMAPGST